MTPNRRIFADEYLRTRNATQAYLKAYPKVKNDNVAAAAAARLLKDVKVCAYIDEQLDKLHNHAIADAAEIMAYYTSVLRGEITEQKVTNAGEVLEVSTSTSDRSTAAKQLAKMLGIEDRIYHDRFEREKAQEDGEGADSVVINI